MAEALADALRAVVGPDHVVDDSGAKSPYEHDLTGRFSGTALLVVRPAETAEVAECLGIPEETVKTRLFRARGLLKTEIESRIEATLHGVHRFHLQRCDRVVEAVLAVLPRIQIRP